MATRQSIEHCINRCEDAIFNAAEQYEESQRQGYFQTIDYSDAQRQLDEAFQEIEKLEDSSNEQQREQLYRTRLRVQQLQNKMILQNHEGPTVLQ